MFGWRFDFRGSCIAESDWSAVLTAFGLLFGHFRQVDQVVDLGELDPESIVTPGIYVQRVVEVAERSWLKDGVFVGAESV